MAGKDVWIVDAFTEKAFAGNSAGVVLDANGLSDPQMQAIAREINSAETTFITRPLEPGADVAFRWFTPAREVEFCGHATLAGVHVLMEAGRVERGTNEFRVATRHRGIVAIRIDAAGVIWIDVPKPGLRTFKSSLEFLAELVGADQTALDPKLRPVLTSDNDLIVAVNGSDCLTQLKPSMVRVRELYETLQVRGLLVTTRFPSDPTIASQSRFFAPAYGVDEDPVTGSAHGTLGLHLVQSGVVPLVDDRAEFCCAQGQPGGRGGVVRVVVTRGQEGWGTRIGGTCVTAIRGEFAVMT